MDRVQDYRLVSLSDSAAVAVLTSLNMFFDIILDDFDPLDYDVLKHSLSLVEVELPLIRIHLGFLPTDHLSQNLVHISSPQT